METGEKIGAGAGGAVGAGAGTTGGVAAVSVAGTAGLSGPGIMSGLATIGFGSAVSGIVIISCGVAVLTGGGIWGGIKIAKWIKKKMS